MAKTIAGLLEVAAGVALEFVPGGQAIGTSLILTGVATTAAALFTPHPKPDQTEMSLKAEPPAGPITIAIEHDDEDDGWVMTGAGGLNGTSSRHDDLFDADELKPAFV